MSFFLLFLSNCSGYEFVYSKHPKIKEIEKQTSFSLLGDDVSIANTTLNNLIGRLQGEAKFILYLEITKTNTPVVIEKNATASKTEVKHKVRYSLVNKINNCKILSKNISTISTYSSSSSGYNFSTDLSKEEVINRNLITNIDEFLDYIITFDGSLNCLNEN